MKTREEIVLLVDSELARAFSRIAVAAPDTDPVTVVGAALANVADRFAAVGGLGMLESVVSSMGDLLAQVREQQTEHPASLN